MGLVFVPLFADGNVEEIGVLRQISQVRVTERLSRAGSISIQVAAAARGSALLAAGRHFRIDSDHTGTVETIAQGRIVSDPRQFDVEGGSVAAEADDLLGELGYRLVDGLLLTEDGLFWPIYAEQHRAAVGTIDEIEADTPITLTIASGDYIYVGYEERFDAVDVTIGTAAPTSWALTVQYFRRDDAGSNGWTTLGAAVDGTDDGSGTLRQSGLVTFIRHDDWVRNLHAGRSLYWVRMQIAGSGDVGIDALQVRSWTGQTTDVITDVLALAPAGWSVSGDYYDTPERGILHQFAEDTVLDALNFIAEQTGEHFRLASSGRVIEWLRTDSPESGVYGVPRSAPEAANPATFVVISVQKKTENGVRPTRIRPYGAGQGAARLTLARATWTPPETEPPQYTIDTENNWIIDGIAEAGGERIEVAVSFSAIGGVDNGQSVAAANELAQTAFVYFTKLQVPITSWRVKGTAPVAPLRCGDRVHLIGIRDAASSEPAVTWNFDGTLYVMERTTAYNADGTVEMELVCNSQRFYPLTDEELLIRNVMDTVRGRRRAQRIDASAIVGGYVQEG